MALPPQRPVSKGQSILQDARTLEEEARQDRHRTQALADLVGEVEDDLEALRARYDLFFIGIERREPARERGEMKRRVARLKGEHTSNTGLRFRIETLHARYLSYERMWVRSAREKEAGTYHRDLVRARRKAEGAAERARGGSGKRKPERAGADPLPAATPTPTASAPAPAAAAAAMAPPPPPRVARAAAPPPPAPAPAAGAAVAGAAGFSEAELRELHARYVEAKRSCQEDVSRITCEDLARTIARQVPAILARYNARSVEWKVVVKDGRAVLKAIPRS